MSVEIETDEVLKESLHELVHGQEKDVLFNGGYEKNSDERLYQGLVRSHDAFVGTWTMKTYQEMLKCLLSVEEGCKDNLKTEY